MKITLLAIALLAAIVLADPESPKWPAKFTIDFKEEFDYPVIGKYKTQGTFYYDATTNRYRVHRDNGKGDRYCALNGFKVLKNTPCDQYVDEHGDRYLHYPDLNECCYCCSAEHGCGILRQDWMADATYQGEIEYNGYTAYKWDKKGLQSNLYIETASADPSDRVMLDMDQQPNDNQIFDAKTWSLSFDSSLLEKPSICKKSNSCAIGSTCTAVRHA